MHTLRLERAAQGHVVLDHVAGHGPAWVYLHGLASVRAGEKSQALFARARARGRACARFDFRGHGESSGRIEDMTITDLLHDTEAVLDGIGPSVLVGSSLGGLIAAWTAARRPDLVRGLLLLAPAFGFLGRMATHRRQDGLVLIESAHTTIRVHERALADAAGYDERELPARIPQQVVVVHGEHDDAVPVAESERFFARLPHAHKKLWVVPGSDHRLNGPIEAILDLLEAELP